MLQHTSEIVCGSCGSAMTPDRGQAAPRSPHSRVAALGLAEQWFVTDEKGRTGPYSAAQLARMLERGALGWTTQVWREGLKDWRPARRDDLLVFAVASVRGMASDTSRLDTLGDLLEHEDTRVEGERPERFELEGERPDRFATAAASSRVAPDLPDRGAGRSDPASEDTQANRFPQPFSWALRHSTLLIALGAFGAGALLTQLSHRFVVEGAQGGPAPAAVAASPAVRAVSASLSLREPRSSASSLRALPDDGELAAELARLDGLVRRCVRRAGELDVSLVVQGESGRVDPARVQARGVRAGRTACVARALAELSVAPFAASEHAVTHHYRW